MSSALVARFVLACRADPLLLLPLSLLMPLPPWLPPLLVVVVVACAAVAAAAQAVCARHLKRPHWRVLVGIRARGSLVCVCVSMGVRCGVDALSPSRSMPSPRLVRLEEYSLHLF